MASDRSRKFRSLTGRINDLDNQLGTISRTAQNVTDGLAEDAVSEDSVLSKSIGSDALQAQSITADKIAPSVFESASSAAQRVPAPLTSTDYWESAISGNITAFADAYYSDKENKNVSVSANGITFSPEANTQAVISTAELLENGLVVIETSTAHGWEVGDYITVTNLGSPLDGEWVITDVQSSTTLCYTLSQYEEDLNSVDLDAYVTYGGTDSAADEEYFTIIRKSFIDGVVTLYLQNNPFSLSPDGEHDYEVGFVVTVSGLGSPYDGQQVVTALPDDSPNAFQYRIDTKTIEQYTPRIKIKSAWGNGDFITYETVDYSTTVGEDSLHDLSVNQFVEISGFTTNTGYNGVKKVSGIFGAGTTFTVDSDVVPATDAPETGGTYWCYNAEVKAEADAVLFLTGKTPVPASRSVVVSWVADKPISLFAVVWDSALPDFPMFLAINADLTESVTALSGLNKYLWEIPQSVSHYAIYAEVLSGGDEVLLKECYVFESVGDLSKKVEKVVNASVASLANSANEITFYTASTHSYEANDRVSLSGMEKISSALNKEFTVYSVATDRKSFTVSVPTQDIVVSTTSGSNSVYTTSFFNETTDTTSNLDVSGLIFIGQSFTSSNTTALPNGTVTQISSSNVLSDVKTGLGATLTSGANTITLISGNTTNMAVGQRLTKTSGTGVFGNSGIVYVTEISSSSAFTVDANHATSGAITFKSSETSKLYDNFVVSNNSGATNSAVTLTFSLTPTEANANISLNGSSLGGYTKHQTSTLNPSGLVITSLSGQAVNLTDDSSDNYVSVYNSDSVAVASISNVGTGTFVDVNVASNVSATNATFTSVVSDSLTTTSAADFLLANSNTYLVGNFANAVYNNTAYTGSHLDRLARGTVYQANWDIPTTNVPSNARYYGLAAGSFQLESDRVYQVFVSMAGLRFNPNKNVSAEILLSDTPIRVTDPETDLARMTSGMRTSNADVYLISGQYFQHLVGFFQSVPATGSTFAGNVTTNLTSATITAWSRASGSNTITVTLANSTPLSSYIKAGDYISTSGMGNTSYHGTWPIASIVNTSAFTYNAYDVDDPFTNTGSTGTITLVDPQLVNASPSFTMISTATATPTTITYPMRNYFVPGQRVNINGSLSPNTFLVSNVVVTAANATSFTVSSSNVGSNSTSTSSLATASWTADQLQKHRSYLPAGKPIYWILRLRFASNTDASVGFTVTGYPNGMLAVSDMGQAKSITYTTQAQDWITGFPPGLPNGFGSTNTTTTVTTFTNTTTLTASSSAYYDNYGKGDSGTTDPYVNEESLYQGNAGTASGTKKSIVVFPAITFPAGTSENRAVTKVEVWLRNRHSYNASGLTTRLGVHSSSTVGTTSIPTSNVSSFAPTTTTFTKGQGKWVTLSSSVNSFALSSTLRGFVLSLIDESPITYDSTLANYGYFDGALQTDPPKLRITYTYTVTTTS